MKQHTSETMDKAIRRIVHLASPAKGRALAPPIGREPYKEPGMKNNVKSLHLAGRGDCRQGRSFILEIPASIAVTSSLLEGLL